MNFASDNVGPAAPEIMAAMSEANAARSAPYGADPWTERAQALIREVFEAPEASVHLVSSGSAANALALAAMTRPWEAIFTHETAHIEMDEAGAPEFFTGGAKLRRVPGDEGKITPAALEAAIAEVPQGDVHSVQRGPLSLTQLTEWGSAYTPKELSALSASARRHGMRTHLDGARLANAIAAAGVSPAEMTRLAGIDALSLGGTKNGCLAVEAVVFFDPARGSEISHRRKRAGHLWSKHRFLGAQMAAYLEDGLWLELAQRANARLAELLEGLRALTEADIEVEPAGNMVFFRLPRAMHASAFAAGAAYSVRGDLDESLPGETPILARIVCDWSCRSEDIAGLLTAWRGA
ncbi:MAG: beta-eliminating lyase-related protein [Pseudomonadota bacterium]